VKLVLVRTKKVTTLNQDLTTLWDEAGVKFERWNCEEREIGEIGINAGVAVV